MMKKTATEFKKLRRAYARRWHVPAIWADSRQTLALPPWPAGRDYTPQAREYRSLAQLRRRILIRWDVKQKEVP